MKILGVRKRERAWTANLCALPNSPFSLFSSSSSKNSKPQGKQIPISIAVSIQFTPLLSTKILCLVLNSRAQRKLSALEYGS
ncbi:unnamed protein product [Citrullus colocynthis]|uniref:Uncharacterized protein n=1 Tax=Citrullus colocynthis TaxID=252529 RepID=A0ABP0YS38_9ROSI